MYILWLQNPGSFEVLSLNRGDKALMERFLNEHRILDVQEVYKLIKNALDKREKLSLVRIGDGEALTLAQQAVLPINEVKRNTFLSYAGVRIPDITGRDMLAASIRKADIIGVPLNPAPYFLPLFLKACKAHGIDLNSLKLTNACINYFLCNSGLLGALLTEGKPRVLVIGNKGKALANLLQGRGINISGIISPVYGLKDVNRVVRIAKGQNFDIALSASGVAAVVICERIATGQKKVALDIGHVADMLIRNGQIKKKG
jgi:hypothetical protein